MLRITTHQDEDEITLQIEGRLDQANIGEVERCWTALCSKNPTCRFCVDLRAVTFIDERGKEFLKQVAQKGGRFLSSGCLVRAYVETLRREA